MAGPAIDVVERISRSIYLALGFGNAVGVRGHFEDGDPEVVVEYADGRGHELRVSLSDDGAEAIGYRLIAAAYQARPCHACTGTGFDSTDPEDGSRCLRCGGSCHEPVPIIPAPTPTDQEVSP